MRRPSRASRSSSELLAELDADRLRSGRRDVDAVAVARGAADERIALRPAVSLTLLVEGVVCEELEAPLAVAQARTEIHDRVVGNLAQYLALRRAQIGPALADVR